MHMEKKILSQEEEVFNFIYNKIYSIWEYGGGEEIIGEYYNGKPIIAKSISGDSIWEFGIRVGCDDYTLLNLCEDKDCPRNYAQLLSGEYDIIYIITEKIVEDYFNE